VTSFEDLHWESLRLVKKHLYRRLATPLNNALGRLAIARHVTDPAEAREQYRRVEYNLEIALNLVKAWAALVHVMNGGTIRRSQRRQLTPGSFPAWLVEHLNTQTAILVEHTQPVVVHPETFYESMLLMCLITAGAGTLKKLTTGDAPNDDTTIWIRAVFEPPAAGPFASLSDLYQRFNTPTPAEQELMFQLQALQEFCRINGATLRLQNNKRTGEQALAASIPAAIRSGFPVATSAQGSADETQETTVAHLLNNLAAQPTNGSKKAVEEVENLPGTRILPSSALHEGMSERLEEIPEAADEVENASDTLIVPPPDFRKELLARAKEAGVDTDSSDPDEVENESDTLIVPPPDFRKQLAQQLEAGSKPDVPAPEPRRPGTGPFTRPPAPGVIEVVEPENASDTLIVPPPDYKRRQGLSHPLSKPSSHYSDAATSEKPEGQDKPVSTE
jgi:hypothetical protein